MTDYIVQGESLSAVADKIREKTDSSASLEFPEGFVDAIDGLIDPTVDVGSVTIPDVEITATPTINITSGGLIMAEVNGHGTITPSVTPGYVSFVEGAEAVATGYASSQLPTQAAQTITPTTVDQLIPAGKYLTGSQIIKGDANLIPANIADGVTIFGVLGTHQGGGAQPQLNAPTISVSSSGNQSVISITNPASNGNFVEKYGVYLDGTWSFDTTSTSNIPITTLGNHSVTVKACGTNFEDSPASNAVTVNNYTITVTCVDCTADVSNPTYISNNGATATLVFTPDTDLEIRADSIVISGASVVSVDKTTGTVVIGSATANVVMTVTALEIPSSAILTVSGLGNEDPTSVVFSESGSPFDWNFQEITVDGNIFIRIPTMYRKVETVVNNQITSFLLSDTKVDNTYEPYPCFLDSDEITVLPYVLIGKYCSSSASVMNSVNASKANQTIENGRTHARALGTGYQLYDWQIQKLFIDLAMMKAKTVNFNSGQTISEYLGIAHLDQNIWIDGIYHNDTTWYAALNPANYVSNPSTHPATGYSALSYAAPTGSGTEVKALGYDSSNPFINYPSAEVSNSSYNTYYCDGHYYSTGNHPVISRVGIAGADYGLWYCGATADWAGLGGARLCYKPISA